jgi:hypothetical protein
LSGKSKTGFLFDAWIAIFDFFSGLVPKKKSEKHQAQGVHPSEAPRFTHKMEFHLKVELLVGTKES